MIDAEKMDVIINIQTMRARLIRDYEQVKLQDFKKLHKMSVRELRDIQEALIPLWNENVKRK